MLGDHYLRFAEEVAPALRAAVIVGFASSRVDVVVTRAPRGAR